MAAHQAPLSMGFSRQEYWSGVPLPSLFDKTDVGNLVSGSSAFSKSSLYIWSFSVHVLLKPSLKDLEYYFASTCSKLLFWVTSIGLAHNRYSILYKQWKNEATCFPSAHLLKASCLSSSRSLPLNAPPTSCYFGLIQHWHCWLGI